MTPPRRRDSRPVLIARDLQRRRLHEHEELSCTYEVRDRLADVTIENGKANTLSRDVIAALGAALTRAEERRRGAGRRPADHRQRPACSRVASTSR